MDDLISKRETVDALIRWTCDKYDGRSAFDVIRQMPSAEPYTIHSDGRLWVTVDDIDKVNAVVVDESKSKFCRQFYMDDKPESKRGKWTRDNACSECGYQPWFSGDIHNYSFCPNCGADMSEVTT